MKNPRLFLGILVLLSISSTALSDPTLCSATSPCFPVSIITCQYTITSNDIIVCGGPPGPCPFRLESTVSGVECCYDWRIKKNGKQIGSGIYCNDKPINFTFNADVNDVIVIETNRDPLVSCGNPCSGSGTVVLKHDM